MSTGNTLKAVLATALVLTAFSSAGAQNILTNSAFESGNLSGWERYAREEATGGVNTAAVHAGTYRYTADEYTPGKMLCPEAEGPGEGCFFIALTSSLEQQFITTPGQTYHVSLWFNAPEDNAGALSAAIDDGNSYDEFYFSSPGEVSDTWLHLEHDFTATGESSRLILLTSDAYSFDDVEITDQSAAPEPASLVLMATGLVGMGAVVRRRKRVL